MLELFLVVTDKVSSDFVKSLKVNDRLSHMTLGTNVSASIANSPRHLQEIKAQQKVHNRSYAVLKRLNNEYQVVETHIC